MRPADSNCATTINFVSYYFRVAFFYLYIGIGIMLLRRRTSFSKRQIFSVQKFSTNSHVTSFWNKSPRECELRSRLEIFNYLIVEIMFQQQQF